MENKKEKILKKCAALRGLIKEKGSKKYLNILNNQITETIKPDPEYLKSKSKFMRAILEKGGKCQKCGLDLISNFFAADFHHLDPKLKSFAISDIRDKSWSVISDELKKCILLCSNCHRNEHSLNSTIRKFMDQIMEKAKELQS